MIATLKDLGRACGVSRQGATKWLRAPGWRWGSGPWDESALVEIRAWVLNRRARAHGEPELSPAAVAVVAGWTQEQYEAFMEDLIGG